MPQYLITHALTHSLRNGECPRGFPEGVKVDNPAEVVFAFNPGGAEIAQQLFARRNMLKNLRIVAEVFTTEKPQLLRQTRI